MAKIWRNRLEAGTQKWEDCPEKYRADVLKLLKDDVKKGKITAERFKEITGEDYEP
jgi:hypothetical protein